MTENARSRGAIAAAAAGVLAAVTVLAVAPNAEAATTLAAAAARSGRYFGATVDSGRLAVGAYSALAGREFGLVTPGRELRIDVTEPGRGRFAYAGGDRIVAWARAGGKRVRGQTLAGAAQQPAWMRALSGSALRGAALNHVTQVASHYRGRIYAWDVVSGAFTTGGARRSTNLQRTGSDWIEAAFRAARGADPKAKLCYGDDGIDDPDRAKTKAVLALVRDFKTRGVPIDCVGLAGRFTAGRPVPAGYRTTLASFAALGVDVQITGLEIPGAGAAQAAKYRAVAGACVAVTRCRGITVGGVRDSDSARSGGTPLLFTATGKPKPAYAAVLTALNHAPPRPACANGYVGLTFDDGPNPDNTTRLIGALRASGVRATLFNIGLNAANNPSLVKAQAAAGMWIGSHGYTHSHMPFQSPAEMSSELSRTQTAIRKAGGGTPKLFRPPYGETSPTLEAVAAKQGLRTVIWDVNSEDWNKATTAQIVRSASTLTDGQSILMHDQYATTIAAIPQIVAGMTRRGLCAGRISPATGRVVAPDGSP